MKAFRLGGWGMYPTALFGILLVAVAVRYAVRPERRFVPLLVCLGIVTLLAGALGFVTGFIKMMDGATSGRWPGPEHVVAMVGLGESLHNVALALLLTMFAALAATIGAFKQRGATSA